MKDKETEYIDIWPQFTELISIHKFYFENILRASGFSLGIIGAYMAFLVRSKIINNWLLVLLFPLLLSLTSFIISVIGSWKTKDLDNTVRLIVLEFPSIRCKPHTEMLFYLTLVFAILFLCTTIGLVWLIFEPELLKQAHA